MNRCTKMNRCVYSNPKRKRRRSDLRPPAQSPRLRFELGCGRSSGQFRRSAFTLIELLAACTLATMLMVLMLGVIGSLSARQKAIRAQPTLAWREPLLEQLRWDLTNAESLTAHANGASMLGTAGRDPMTGMPTQRPTEVFWFIKKIEGRSWLVRRETQLDDVGAPGVREELACSDVSAIAIRPDGLPQSGLLAQHLPQAVTVSLVDQNGTVIVNKVFRWR